jgi:hypothetical protein
MKWGNWIAFAACYRNIALAEFVYFKCDFHLYRSRSPPIEMPPYKFGTIRHPPTIPPAVSTDAMNRTPRPQVPPPRPPNTKPPPPPTPKSSSTTHLQNVGLSVAPESLGGSAINLSMQRPNTNGHTRSSSSLTSNDLPNGQPPPPPRSNTAPQPPKGNVSIYIYTLSYVVKNLFFWHCFRSSEIEILNQL